jgi:predicted dehydrogenase
MTQNNKVRIGVIGVGTMGSCHARDLQATQNAELAAVCDIDPQRADLIGGLYEAPVFYDYQDMLAKTSLDAVIVATPHYFHTPISIDCLGRGIHVLCEKPLAVHVKDGKKMIAAYEAAKVKKPDLVFAIMFQQRTLGFWRKIKEMLDTGRLGKLVRATWIITDWFRTQTYYNNGGWRATWKGEGGGVLLNQCPHNLDLYQWFFGMPRRVAGFASIGKYHQIEVEDEVTGYFEHENGMVGHFITTTAESPGTNRLEIAGELGKLVFEDGKLTFLENTSSMFEFIKTSPAAWDRVDYQVQEIPYEESSEAGHILVTSAFAEAIRHGTPLIAEAVEGIRSLTIGNAIMLSSFQRQPVEIPIDEEAYEAKLLELIRTSTFQKEVKMGGMEDFNKSFGFLNKQETK